MTVNAMVPRRIKRTHGEQDRVFSAERGKQGLPFPDRGHCKPIYRFVVAIGNADECLCTSNDDAIPAVATIACPSCLRIALDTQQYSFTTVMFIQCAQAGGRKSISYIF
jgi:hypothetical protein